LNYPNYILEPIDSNNISLGFRFKPAVAYFLSEIAKVDIGLINNCKVKSRSFVRYIPWYSAQKGGGAITLGNANWQTITYTENFFSDDTSIYPHTAYANKLYTWLSMSAHEVGHLTHAFQYKSIIFYLFIFIYQYGRYGHDKAPLEKEANYGSDNFLRLRKYLTASNQNEKLQHIFESDQNEKEKIKLLEALLIQYRTNFSSDHRQV